MASSMGSFLLWVLLAAIVSNVAVVPVLGWCNNSPCHRSNRRGGYYSPPSRSSSPKSPCPTPARNPSPSPCSKPPSSSSSSPPCKGSSSSSNPAPNTPKSPSTTPTPTPTTPTPTPTTPTPTPTTPTPTTPTPTPTTPSTTPGTTVPPIFTHPFVGTCDFWRTHPEIITQILGYWGPIANMFNMPAILSMFGGGIPTFPQALSCTSSDGYGALVREGAAALLNSMVKHPGFPYSTSQIQRSFYGALYSDAAAAAQAQLFKAANEGHYH